MKAREAAIAAPGPEREPLRLVQTRAWVGLMALLAFLLAALTWAALAQVPETVVGRALVVTSSETAPEVLSCFRVDDPARIEAGDRAVLLGGSSRVPAVVETVGALPLGRAELAAELSSDGLASALLPEDSSCVLVRLRLTDAVAPTQTTSLLANIIVDERTPLSFVLPSSDP